jgi:hypothetical protein
MSIKIRPIEREPRRETDAEKAAHERRERPYPLPGESFGEWLSRIGGPLVKLEQLQQCPKCGSSFPVEKASSHRCSEKIPLTGIEIDKTGNLRIPEWALRNPQKIREMIEKGDPNLSVDEENNFYFKKEAFEEEEKPIKTYLDFIKSKIEDEIPVTADEDASEGFEEWVEKLETKKEKEGKMPKGEELEERE